MMQTDWTPILTRLLENLPELVGLLLLILVGKRVQTSQRAAELDRRAMGLASLIELNQQGSAASPQVVQYQNLTPHERADRISRYLRGQGLADGPAYRIAAAAVLAVQAEKPLDGD